MASKTTTLLRTLWANLRTGGIAGELPEHLDDIKNYGFDIDKAARKTGKHPETIKQDWAMGDKISKNEP